MHQLRPLLSVTETALADDPSVVLFCLPDLQKHDGLRPQARQTLAARRDMVMLP
jgi:hypothetical protein